MQHRRIEGGGASGIFVAPCPGPEGAFRRPLGTPRKEEKHLVQIGDGLLQVPHRSTLLGGRKGSDIGWNPLGEFPCQAMILPGVDQDGGRFLSSVGHRMEAENRLPPIRHPAGIDSNQFSAFLHQAVFALMGQAGEIQEEMQLSEAARAQGR
ncbi:MAG TPA: hypothetical protein VNZ61_14720 [Roseomonas sp.]|nr:hypothetical protein [Roseomonas sp.]